MKHYLILSSVLSLTACTAHVGYNDIGRAFQGLSQQKVSPSVQQCAYYATKRAAENAQGEFDYKQQLLSSLERRLPENPAWNGQSCQRPTTQVLPPEPKGMSHAQAEFQATGACVDLAVRRHASAKVMQSLISIRQEKLWNTYEQWRKSPQASCALSYMPSQAVDFVVRMCGVFGYEASNSCLMDYIAQCSAEVMQSCRAEHIAWQNQVNAIKTAPDQSLQECQRSLEQIANLERELPHLHVTAQLNREEHQKISRPNVSETMCR